MAPFITCIAALLSEVDAFLFLWQEIKTSICPKIVNKINFFIVVVSVVMDSESKTSHSSLLQG